MKSLKSMRIRLSSLFDAVILPISRSRFANFVKTTFLFRIYKSFILDSIFIIRDRGFKALLKEKGWKFFVVICLYYLIRDSILYIIIPLLIAKGLIN